MRACFRNTYTHYVTSHACGDAHWLKTHTGIESKFKFHLQTFGTATISTTRCNKMAMAQHDQRPKNTAQRALTNPRTPATVKVQNALITTACPGDSKRNSNMCDGMDAHTLYKCFGKPTLRHDCINHHPLPFIRSLYISIGPTPKRARPNGGWAKRRSLKNSKQMTPWRQKTLNREFPYDKV